MRTIVAASLACLVAAIGLASCSTLNSDASFLVDKLDDQTKSRVLVDAGAAAWNDVVVDQGNISQIGAIREYFVVALHYNPQNQNAYRWLNVVNDYRSAKVKDAVGDARGLLKKSPRREEDDYALAMAVRRANQLDPQNAEVVKLVNDTSAVRGSLATVYVKRANAALDRVGKNAGDAVREAAYIDAFQNAVRATNVDPKDAQAASLRGSLRSQILGIIRKRLDAAPKLVDAAKFSAARAQIDTAADLNRKAGGEFRDAVVDAYYQLNLRWAQYNFKNQDYAAAENRVAAAIDYKRGPEAVELQKRISKLRDQVDQSASLDTTLSNIDKLIAAGDLVPAQRQLIGASSLAKDQAAQDQLEARRKRIRAGLADLYAKGVQYYKGEDFGNAIDALEVVNSVDPGYEQAADYLEKARQKKRLLDTY